MKLRVPTLLFGIIAFLSSASVSAEQSTQEIPPYLKTQLKHQNKAMQLADRKNSLYDRMQRDRRRRERNRPNYPFKSNTHQYYSPTHTHHDHHHNHDHHNHHESDSGVGDDTLDSNHQRSEELRDNAHDSQSRLS